MKDYEDLNSIKDIGTLLQYLAFSEKNFIITNITSDKRTKVWMDEEYILWGKLIDYPDSYIMDFSDFFSVKGLLGFIDELKRNGDWEELQVRVDVDLINISEGKARCSYCNSRDTIRSIGETKYAFYEIIKCKDCGFEEDSREWIKREKENVN